MPGLTLCGIQRDLVWPDMLTATLLLVSYHKFAITAGNEKDRSFSSRFIRLPYRKPRSADFGRAIRRPVRPLLRGLRWSAQRRANPRRGR
jgi:hypothetical protein